MNNANRRQFSVIARSTRSACIAFLVAFLVLVPVASCKYGLQPARNAERTSLSIAFGRIETPGSDSIERAIVQEKGYLYIRTVGGPEGEEGPFYGPFPASPGASITTFDIPSGSYSQMYILYAPRILPDTPMLSWRGSTYSFLALMRLNESEFLEAVGLDNELSGVVILDDDYFKCEVSGAIIGPVTLKSNANNRVSATLTPFQEPRYTVNVSASNSVELPVAATLARKFYTIEGINPSASGGTVDLSCEFTPAAGNTVSLGIVAWYDESGALIKSFAPAGTVSVATTHTATIASSNSAYLYVEYAATAPVTLRLSGMGTVVPPPMPPPTPPPTPTIYTCTASYQYPLGAAGAGQTFFFSVNDVTGVSSTGTTFPIDDAGTRVGVGMFTLDSSGAGSAVAINPATGNPAELVVGHDYQIHSFLDLTDDYDSITAVSEISTVETGMIVPNYGDYSCVSPTSFTVNGSSANSVVTLGTHASHSKHVYFVKSGTSGSGLKYSDPCDFDTALSAIMVSSYDAEVFVIGDVSMVAPYTLTSKVFLRGYDPALVGNPVITYPGGVGSMFTVNFGASLVLARVTLDATAEIAISSSKVVVNSGSLIMAEGSVISGVNASQSSGASCSGVNGGAVSVSGGTLEMYGNATIRNCKAYYGAGVFVTGTNGAIKMFGSSLIENCDASAGGGVRIESGTGLTMLMDDASAIKNCVGWGGGGVMIGTGVSSFTMKGSSSITGCTSSGTNSGGGVAVWEPTIAFSITDTARITGNVAGAYGGGVYCSFTDPGWTAYSAFVYGNTENAASTPTLEAAGVYFVP